MVRFNFEYIDAKNISFLIAMISAFATIFYMACSEVLGRKGIF